MEGGKLTTFTNVVIKFGDIKMNKNKIENVTRLPVEDRYTYFIQKVTDFEQVWGLRHNHGWAVLSDNDGKVVVPFWPEEEFASLCCSGQWENYDPQAITLNDFMNKWLPGMVKDHRMASIFYVGDDEKGAIIDPANLLQDLKEVLEDYF